MTMNQPYTHDQYVLPEGLLHALEGAIALQQPLLLTGEPGTGKTTLADWAVGYLGNKYKDFHPEVLKFHTKTTSLAQDLFYTYDALAHFQSANLEKSKRGSEDFIELQALGKAIAMSNPKDEYKGHFTTELPDKATNSVVLIDEIDKAPRDFTNDILDEIDRQRFRIKEKNLSIGSGGDARIVVIMTSNSEKNLPDAFLRRCVFFHIDFPSDERLRKILKVHFGDQTSFTGDALDELLKFFYDVCEKSVRKKPATAELIGWLKMLEVHKYFQQSDSDRKKLMLHNLSFLVKTKEDLDAVKDL